MGPSSEITEEKRLEIYKMTQEAKGVLEALVKNIKECREVYSDQISDHEVGVLKDALKDVMTTMNAVANLEEFQDFKHLK